MSFYSGIKPEIKVGQRWRYKSDTSGTYTRTILHVAGNWTVCKIEQTRNQKPVLDTVEWILANCKLAPTVHTQYAYLYRYKDGTMSQSIYPTHDTGSTGHTGQYCIASKKIEFTEGEFIDGEHTPAR